LIRLRVTALVIGKIMEARMAMTAMTTSISMREKAEA
jgi:hypothetical protein